MILKPVRYVLLLMIVAGGAHSAEETVDLVAYSDCSPWTRTLNSARPFYKCNRVFSKRLTFAAKGQDIIGLDRKSLKLSKLKIGDGDFRYDEKGSKRYKILYVPRVDAGGKYVIFDLELKLKEFGGLDFIEVEGQVDLFIGRRFVSKAVSGLDIENGFRIQEGPFTISSKKRSKTEAGKSTPSSSGLNSVVNLEIDGPMNAFASLKAFESGQSLNRLSTSNVLDEQNQGVSFVQPLGSTIDIRLSYWKDVKRITVPIRHGVVPTARPTITTPTLTAPPFTKLGNFNEQNREF